MTGLPTMVRVVLRRNRVRLTVWGVMLVALFAYVVEYYKGIFTNQRALDDFAAVSNVPSIKALTGLAAAPNTLGGAVWTKIWMTCALTLAFGVVFLVTRNGRADEEAGRSELLRSRVLGLHAYSVATWLVVSALTVVVGVGVAVVSVVGGLDPTGSGITGSVVNGMSMTGVGLLAVAIGALAGQVASTARGANALGSGVLAVFYLVRMVGDLGDGRLTWVSPIGWGQQMQPWGANRWWPLGLLVLLSAALLGLSAWVEARRDFGAGLLPDRRGRPVANRSYATPVGLGLRLQRGPIIGWTLTVALSAAMFGTVAKAMTDLLDDAGASVPRLLRGTGVEALMAMLMMMIAMITTVFAVQSAVTLRQDEASGLLEPQLAGSLSRVRWAAERLLIPAVGSALLLLLGGAVTGAGYGATVGDADQTRILAMAALAYWPAVMTFVGFAVLLFGWVPRLTVPLSWGVLVAMWVVVLLGDALHLPAWLLDTLPLSATPYQPLEPMSWTPLLVMTLAAVVLGWIGLDRFQRRDISPD
jgi:ABC-2 type transport system permease protein